MIFAHIGIFFFTLVFCFVINNYILLNKPAKTARTRESLLTQYIFFYHPQFETYRDHIIEIPDNEHHLLIGCSERTTIYAAQQVMKVLFEKNVIDTITVVKIPKKRDYMHIDTVFTQVKRNVWVLLGSIAR